MKWNPRRSWWVQTQADVELVRRIDRVLAVSAGAVLLLVAAYVMSNECPPGSRYEFHLDESFRPECDIGSDDGR